MKHAVAFLTFGLVMALTGCGSGADPGYLTSGRMHGGPLEPGTLEPSAGTDPASAVVDDAGADPTDAGVVVDSGRPEISAPAGVFQGAPAFVATLGPSTRQPSHNFPGNTPTTSPRGQACGSCHTFALGGTVWADGAGTNPAAGVEVRARDAAGNAVSAWTDQDGNFYVAANAVGALRFPVQIGARNATQTAQMASSIAVGTCAAAACHAPGQQSVVHLP